MAQIWIEWDVCKVYLNIWIVYREVYAILIQVNKEVQVVVFTYSVGYSTGTFHVDSLMCVDIVGNFCSFHLFNF